MAAVQALRDATGFHATLLDRAPGQDADVGIDGVLELAAHGIRREFFVEVKRHLTPATLGGATQQLLRIQRRANVPQKGLIVTTYVNPQMAERLKAMDMPFLDLAGNAYINAPPVYVYIRGNKPPATRPARPKTRAFQPTGLKVVFGLLCDPGLAEAPYRDIAQATGVALGTVGWVINDLRDLGYLVDMGKRGRRLARRKQLIDRWVMAWAEVLRPKLLLGRYTGAEQNWWERVRITDYDACWGGEVAAARLTTYLKPQLITIYADKVPGRFLLENRLRADRHGDVEILQAFWRTKRVEPCPELAPPLLVYADLLATGDPRNIDTADLLYNHDIAGLVGED